MSVIYFCLSIIYLVASPSPQSLLTGWTVSVSQFCLFKDSHTHPNPHLPTPSFMELCPQQKDQWIKYLRSFESEVHFTAKFEVLVVTVIQLPCSLPRKKFKASKSLAQKKLENSLVFVWYCLFNFPFSYIIIYTSNVLVAGKIEKHF